MTLSSLHAQSNGLTERFNQTLTRCLAKVVDDSQTDWDIKIDTVLMGYRAAQQASTKHSPYYMLFQKNMRLPIHNEVSPSCEKDGSEGNSEDDIDGILGQFLSSRERTFKTVEENIKAAQDSQKETYDRKHQPQVLQVGTEVLLENTKQKQRKGGKMEPLWLGPYTIKRDLGKGLYELSNTSGTVLKKKANINRLKLYSRRDDDPPTRNLSDPPRNKRSLSSPCSPEQPKKRKPPATKVSNHDIVLIVIVLYIMDHVLYYVVLLCVYIYRYQMSGSLHSTSVSGDQWSTPKRYVSVHAMSI